MKKPVVFGCGNVLRKVLAFAVILTVIAVSVYAVSVVLRHGELTVNVAGFSSLIPTTTPQQHVRQLTFVIDLDNFSARGTIYYTGVTAQLVASAKANGTVNFTLHDIIVKKQTRLMFDFSNYTSYGEELISSGNLIVRGTLTTNLYELHNRTSPTTYTCCNVTVANSSYVDDSAADYVLCQKSAAAAPNCGA